MRLILTLHNTARSFYIYSVFKRIYWEFTPNDGSNDRRRDKYMDPPYKVLGDRMENGANVWVVIVYWRDECYEDLHGVILYLLVLPGNLLLREDVTASIVNHHIILQITNTYLLYLKKWKRFPLFTQMHI